VPPCRAHCVSERHWMNVPPLRIQHTRATDPSTQSVRPPVVVGQLELDTGAVLVAVVVGMMVASVVLEVAATTVRVRVDVSVVAVMRTVTVVVVDAVVVVTEYVPPCVEHCVSERHRMNVPLLRLQHTRGVGPMRQFRRPSVVVGHSELTSGAAATVVVSGG
jgi:hypothetical protein